MSKIVGTFAVLALLGSAPAWSQTPLTGRITYLDPDKHELMLDGNYLYKLDPGVNLDGIAIAEQVTLTVKGSGAWQLVTRITRKG